MSACVGKSLFFDGGGVVLVGRVAFFLGFLVSSLVVVGWLVGGWRPGFAVLAVVPWWTSSCSCSCSAPAPAPAQRISSSSPVRTPRDQLISSMTGQSSNEGRLTHSEEEKLLLTTLRPSHKANKTPSTEPPKTSWWLDKTISPTTWKDYLLHEPIF